MIANATEKNPVSLSRLRAVPVRRVRGRFDSAVTTHDNRRHWANADALSADAAASADVRRTLRNRARYEVANNSYARGIVLTLANDTIGTGPRLQMLSENEDANREIEREFERWAQEIHLAEKLRTMRMARAQDGESFAILVIPDAGLRLTPGQRAEVREPTKQIEGLIASGHLARVGDSSNSKQPEPANTTEPMETPDLSKMTAQQAIASVAEMDDPERIKAAIESEKRRSMP